MKKLRKCVVCGEFTLKEQHCGTQTESAHPPKYSPKDKYSKYKVILNDGD